jgi:hypothetical protein
MTAYFRRVRVAAPLCVLIAASVGFVTFAHAQTAFFSTRVMAPESVESSDGKATIVTVQVQLSEPPGEQVTLGYATLDIGRIDARPAATPDVDYVETSGSLVFGPDQTTASFTVTLIDDAILEESETVAIVVARNEPERLLSLGTSVLVIAADDSQRTADPGVGFVNEGEGQIVHIPITLSQVSGFDIEIPWRTLNVPDGPAIQALAPGDYTEASGTVRIPKGRLTGVVDIAVRGDRVREADEVIVVSFGEPTGGAQIGGFFGLGFGGILDGR